MASDKGQGGGGQQSILMLAKAFPPVTGGVETYSEQVARAYLRRGWRVTVITQGAGVAPGLSTRSFPEGEIEIHECGPGGQLHVAFAMRRLAAPLLRANDYRIVHATTWRPLAALLGLRIDARSVLTVHGREVMYAPRWAAPVMRHLLRAADVVVAVSTVTRNRAGAALRMPEGAVRWLIGGNGLSFTEDATRFDRAPTSGKTKVFTVARLVERKNVQGVLKALERLPREIRAGVEYVVAGTGPMLQQLILQTRRAELEGVVSFVGRIDDDELVDRLKGADIFVHPQISTDGGRDFEGFGLVVADAMSFGCAVLAGKDGGPSDFVFDGDTGLLVDGLKTDEITRALALLVTDFAERTRLAERGRAYALAQLSWDAHVGAILDEVET